VNVAWSVVVPATLPPGVTPGCMVVKVATSRPIVGSEFTIAGSTLVPVPAFIVCRSDPEVVTSMVVSAAPTAILKFAVVCSPTLTVSAMISSVENPSFVVLTL
jgi:hypothetical protein